MNVQTPPAAARDAGIGEAEWRLRVDLAGAYRIYDHLGWSEVIMNHLTVRVPGPEHHFLINPYGLTYDEVTASNLVKVDMNGNIVGHSDWPVNPAGFVIHSAVHAGREDAICVMHTHTTEAPGDCHEARRLPARFDLCLAVLRTHRLPRFRGSLAL